MQITIDKTAIYRDVYNSAFALLTPGIQKKVLEVKTDNSIRDPEVTKFIEKVLFDADALITLKETENERNTTDSAAK